MKRIGCILMALVCVYVSVQAQVVKQNIVSGVSVENLTIDRSGKFIVVDMTLNLTGLDIENNRAVLLTPRLTKDNHSMDLQSIGIYGRRRYYYYLRNGGMLTGDEEQSFKAKERPNEIAYHYVVPYTDWMNGAELALYRGDYGCCNMLLDKEIGTLSYHKETFFPELVYIRPQAERVKSYAIEGSAFIDFPVDKIDIYPEYRGNTEELSKIAATIDSVRNDSDITITSIWLKGFASPESPYSHNSDLAKGRTEALKKYIQRLYKFDNGIISTDFEPEDWVGLRNYVEHSNINHKEEILALIDSEMEFDAKEAKIKQTYPNEYRFLLQNSYPALRHTDYRIAYTIRTYSDVADIKRVMQEQPQKLDLNEFYLVAQEYEPGTDEFSEVFETAVRMYPNDPIANLNAANAAIRRGDLNAAERYLTKAGDSPEAIYTHGALAIRKEDYEAARKYLNQAKELGLKQAEITLQELEQGRR